MHAPDLVKKFLQRQWRSTCIASLKAELRIVQSPMPSRPSAPSLPSPKLYSLDHYIWYDGLMHTTPSPQEGELQPGQMPDNCMDDDSSEDKSFHTATSSPSSPKLGEGETPDPTCTETVPHQGHIWHAALANPAQNAAGGRSSLPLPEQASP